MGKEDMGQQNTVGIIYLVGPDGRAYPALRDAQGRLLVAADLVLDDVSIDVNARNIKDYTDIDMILDYDYSAGVEPPEVPVPPPVTLTAQQTKDLFDKDGTTVYNLPSNHGLMVLFKVPNYVYDLEVVDYIGIDLQGDYLPIYTDGRPAVPVSGVKSLKVEAKLSGFYFVNRSAAQVTVGSIIVREFVDSRANAPKWQPLNTNPLNEVVWEDIDLAHSQYRDSNRNGTFSQIAGDLAPLFDKLNVAMANGSQMAAEMYFKRPINIGHLKLTNQYNRALAVDGQWQFQAQLTDGTTYQEQHQSSEGENITPPVDICLNRQVSNLQLQIQLFDNQGELGIAELLMTIAHTVEVSSDAERPVHARSDDEVLYTDVDFANSYYEISANPGIPLIFEQNYGAARQFFDKHSTTSAQDVSKVNLVLNKPMNAGYVKFVDAATGLAYEVPADHTWQATLNYSDGTEPLALTIEAGSFLDFYINAQLSSLSVEDVTEETLLGFSLSEIVITLFREVEVSSSPTKPVYVTGATLPNPLPVSLARHLKEVVDGAASGANLLPSAGTGLKNVIYTLIISTSVANTVTLSDGMGSYYAALGVPIVVQFPGGLAQDTGATAITVTLSGLGTWSAVCIYDKEA